MQNKNFQSSRLKRHEKKCFIVGYKSVETHSINLSFQIKEILIRITMDFATIKLPAGRCVCVPVEGGTVGQYPN